MLQLKITIVKNWLFYKDNRFKTLFFSQNLEGTPSQYNTPSMSTPMGPKAMSMQTPHPSNMAQMTPEQLQAVRWEQEIDTRNRPLSDEELDQMFPPGYKVLQPPAGYIPIRTPAKKLTATPTPMSGQTPTGFYMQPDTPYGDR